MSEYASIGDIISLFRPLNPEEQERAVALLPVVSDALRQEAKNVGKDLDEMISTGKVLPNTVKSVTVDVVSRMIMNPTNGAPLSQFSQGAMGYTFSGTYLVPGGGFFIKKSELSRLGIRRQRIGAVEMYDTGNDG